MHLKTLTVRGFKSFASATTFDFEPGVTAVVGPNGSGKSNVVDALAWVMGEQGAKSLRGGKMEDVIFAGTSDRPALGRAQVTLTIDNADGALPIEYSEVTISRTLFRTGGSEYAINGSPCRLLDIQELLSDSGLGREMHVIVGQGQLDRILHATPEERRGFIEEAAGVLKHRRRKEKTVRKLASMETNLSRLEDLTQEVGRQLTPLGRQAAVARRAQRIQHDLRDARARLFADDWVQACTAVQTDLDQLRELQEQLEQAESQHGRLTAETARLEAESAALDPQVTAAREEHYALGQLTERYASLDQLVQERLRAAAQPASRGHLRDPQTLEAQAQRIGEQLERVRERLDQARAVHTEAQEATAEAEAEQRRCSDHHAALTAAAASRRENIAALRGKMATAQSRYEAAVTARESQQQHLEQIRQRLSQRREELALLDEASGPTEEDHRAAAEASEAAHQQAEQSQQQLDAAAQQVHEARRELGGASARVQALEESLPAADATESILQAFTTAEDRPLRRLREELSVHGEWAGALAAALGHLAEGLVLTQPHRAGEILSSAREHSLGVVSLLLEHQPADEEQESAGGVSEGAVSDPLLQQAVRQCLLQHEQTASASGQEQDRFCHPAEAITAGRHRNSVLCLLRRTVLACDAADALALAKHLHRTSPQQGEGDWLIAARDGTVLTPHTATGGSQQQGAGLEIAARLEQARAQQTHWTQRLDQAQQSHEQAAETHRERRDAAQAARAEFSRISQESTASAAAHSRARTLVTTAEEEHQAARTRLDELIRAEPEAERAVQQAEAAVAAAREVQQQEGTEALDAAAAAQQQAEQTAQQSRRAETEALLAVRAAESEVTDLSQRQDQARRAIAQEKTAHADWQRRERRREARHRHLIQVQSMIAQAAEALADAVTAAGQHREQLQSRRAEVEAALTQARQEERKHREILDGLRSRAHSGELEKATREARLESLRESILEELSLTVETLVEDYGPHLMVPVLDEAGEAVGEQPFERAAQEQRLQRARKDLKALGKVNPLALEEYAALEERHTYLTGQLEDLRKSRADLEEIIRDVDRHVREAFAQAFEDTHREFVDVFQQLFPGGEGKLVLTTPSDLLNTGIEVQAKPAGKKVRRLSLLSGGERSLTAIAMLVAIFKARPSPFYVMDEVEAALDDRNLGRLLGILKQLQLSSQLIIITHQKRTMEIADALYGVSMRGDGITQVISQRLADLS